MIVLLVLLVLHFRLFFVFFLLLLSLQQTRSVGNPIIAIRLMAVPNVVLLDSVLLFVLSSQIEQIVDVVQLIVRLVDVLLESLQFEVDLEALLPANETV